MIWSLSVNLGQNCTSNSTSIPGLADHLRSFFVRYLYMAQGYANNIVAYMSNYVHSIVCKPTALTVTDCCIFNELVGNLMTNATGI